MAWVGPAIGGAASLAGGLLSGSSSAASMANYDATQLQLQQNQENYNTNMADTEYQRAVSSMQAAGLNPALAYQQGGISVPAAPTANIQPVPGVGQAVGQALSNAGMGFSNVGPASAQKALTDAQADKVRADTATTLAGLPFAGATASQTYFNMKDADDLLNKQWDNVVADTAWKMDNNSRQNAMNELMLRLGNLDFQRQQLAMPRAMNDAAWQKAHPGLSGWLQSQAVPQAAQGLSSVTNTAAKLFGSFGDL